jgi:hypothetical protein
MSTGAKVESLDAIKHFRQRILKFAETAGNAMGEAEGEMHRMLVWLETEARTYWQHQLRVRYEGVVKAKEAVRMKALYKDATGSRQSVVDEQRALAIAQKRLEHAEKKVAAVKRHAARLTKEIQLYRGGVQRLATTVQVDMPNAGNRLKTLLGSLEAYVSMAPETMGSTAEQTSAPDVAPMTRGADDIAPTVEPTDAKERPTV